MERASFLPTAVNVVKSDCFYSFPQTPNRRGAQFHSKSRLIFVLNSRVDPTGDQTDVQYLSVSIHILSIFGKSGTVPTYGTVYVDNIIAFAAY